MYSGIVDIVEVFKPKVCVPRNIKLLLYRSAALSPQQSLPCLDDAAF